MNKSTAESIRVRVASGLYHKKDLWLSMRQIVNYAEFVHCVTYESYPEVRKDLAKRILEVDSARELYEDYQVGIRKLAESSMYADEKMGKGFGYEIKKENLESILKESIRKLPTINMVELPKFL